MAPKGSSSVFDFALVGLGFLAGSGTKKTQPATAKQMTSKEKLDLFNMLAKELGYDGDPDQPEIEIAAKDALIQDQLDAIASKEATISSQVVQIKALQQEVSVLSDDISKYISVDLAHKRATTDMLGGVALDEFNRPIIRGLKLADGYQRLNGVTNHTKAVRVRNDVMLDAYAKYFIYYQGFITGCETPISDHKVGAVTNVPVVTGPGGKDIIFTTPWDAAKMILTFSGDIAPGEVADLIKGEAYMKQLKYGGYGIDQAERTPGAGIRQLRSNILVVDTNQLVPQHAYQFWRIFYLNSKTAFSKTLLSAIPATTFDEGIPASEFEEVYP